MLFSELISGEKILSKRGNFNIPVRGIAYDSRKVEKDYLFVAIKGLQTDGHIFAGQAVANGATALVVQGAVDETLPVAWARVPDTRLALSTMSARFYGEPSSRLKLIGVTGTNGKTTTTYLLRSIYQNAGSRVGLIGTIANWCGERMLPTTHTTPESHDLQKLLAEMAGQGVDTIIMEVSSHALALHRVAGCHFNTAIFTNLTQDHLDLHQNMKDYLAAKKILFQMAEKLVVINNDSPAAAEIEKKAQTRVISYGINNKADLTASSIRVGPKGVSYHVHTPWGDSQVNLKLTGYFNVYNSLAALAAGGAQGLELDKMAQALESVGGVPGRFELVERGQDFTVIVDYAHTPDGLENVLKTARQLTKGRLITVFGCGGDRDRGKRPLMGEVAAVNSDFIIITSDNPRTEEPLQIIAEIENGLGRCHPRYTVLPDRREAISCAIRSASPGDVVVIAGKGHEEYQIISGKKLPFSDCEEASKALKRLYKGEY